MVLKLAIGNWRLVTGDDDDEDDDEGGDLAVVVGGERGCRGRGPSKFVVGREMKFQRSRRAWARSM